MDEVLELVQFEEFFKALEKTKRNGERMEKCWSNPSAQRELAPVLWGIAGSAALVKWRGENPEKHAANVERAKVFMVKWREEHPETALLHIMNAQNAATEWREENPEEVRANLERCSAAGLAAAAQWREEHPKEHAINMEKWKAAPTKWQIPLPRC